jgi:preprotein translocase subunit SecF
MLEIFKSTKYDFIKHSAKAIGFSLIVIVSSWIFMIATGGFNFAVDFTGGTLVQVKFKNNVDDKELAKIRGLLQDIEITPGQKISKPEVKNIGPKTENELQITVKEKLEGNVLQEKIRETLTKGYGEDSFELRRQELVGPKIGKELKTNAIVAVILSLIALLIYVGVRFSLPFAFAAIVPIFHDVIISLAPMLFIRSELSLATMAALLTIAGYSLNDTIVIFDRIRENIRSNGLKNKSFPELINMSINQTLSRTIITFTAMIFVVAMLFFFGGEAIKDFSLPMFAGTIAGVYSTIYIASPILIWWNKKWPITKV